MSTFARIPLNCAFNKPNKPKSNQQERKGGKEEGEKKKLSILMFFYIADFRERSYSLASLDGQRRVLPRAEVISIVFIKLI